MPHVGPLAMRNTITKWNMDPALISYPSKSLFNLTLVFPSDYAGH